MHNYDLFNKITVKEILAECDQAEPDLSNGEIMVQIGTLIQIMHE